SRARRSASTTCCSKRKKKPGRPRHERRAGPPQASSHRGAKHEGIRMSAIVPLIRPEYERTLEPFTELPVERT
ncbi:hypothetical protein, partial [Mycobacterium tuberculosis]|uniref:hypothetical protein n=1 Tax=Mycobacterium tuberculosis TaxID=1773 RepID=UPI001158200A